jgi:Tol biopolymer transport system component
MAAVRPPAAVRPKWLMPVVAVGALAIIAVAVVLMTLQQGTAPQTAPAAVMEMVSITSDGTSSEATISADGRYVAYVTRDERNRHALGYTQVSTGSAVIIVPAEDEVFLWDPVFSPDGEYIYFIRNVLGPQQPALHRVPVLGGSPQKVKEHVNGRPSFSPDGTEYVFLRIVADGDQLVIAGAGGQERILAERRSPEDYNDPVWSPDGTTIMVGGQDAGAGDRGQVIAIPASGGEGRVVATERTWTNVGEMSWLPDGSGVVAEVEQNYNYTRIWEVPYRGGEPRRVTTDLNTYHGVEITADGGTIVTQQMLQVTNLWAVRDGQPEQLTSVGRGAAANSPRTLPDGRFVYQSNQGGSWDIWIRDANGQNPRRLTTEGTNALPSPSPDGREIAFVSDRAGGLDIWRMPVSGGMPTRITHGGFAMQPEWAGDRIFFRAKGTQPGTVVLHQVPVDGGDAEQVTQVTAWAPRVSPDGTRLMYHRYNSAENHNQIEIMALDTRDVEHVIYLRQWEEAAWSPDGTAIHYSKHTDGQDNVWSHPISAGDDTSGDVRITDFDDRVDILSMIWSQDGSTLVLSRGKTSRDVVLLKGFR